MVKRTLSFVVALSLTATLLAGCGEKKQEAAQASSSTAVSTAASTQQEQSSQEPVNTYGDTGGLKLPVVDKPVTVSWMLAGETQNANDKAVIKEIEKRTGVKVDVQMVSAANYADKSKITLASGKLPDIMEGVPVSEINALGTQGAFAAINQYIDQLPNFKKLYVDENPWVMKSYADDSGNIYTWPVYGLNRDVNHGILYRKDILDKNGITEWTNTDEFYQALKKLKEIYPKSYPVASKTGQYIFRDWSTGWGMGGDETYPMYYDEGVKLWKLATIQPEFKAMIDFMKKLYNEGLLDPEFMTDTQTSWTAKMTSDDKAFVTYDWIGRLDMFYNQVKDVKADYNLRYGNPIGPTGLNKSLPKVINFGTVIANNANKEAALKMMDYLTSPSGSELICLGIKDEEFTIGSDGKVTYPELKDLPKVDISAISDKYGCFYETMYLNVDKRSVYFNFTEKEQEAQDKIVKANKLAPLDPVLRFTDEQSSTISDLQSALDKSGVEFATTYIMTKSYGDAQWNEWVAKAEKMNSKKLEDTYNEAQKKLDTAN